MIILTKEQLDLLLKSIMEKVTDPTMIADTVQEIQNLFTAVIEEKEDTGSGEPWENKYNELRADYINRFFAGNAPTETVETTEETPTDFNELFEEVN